MASAWRLLGLAAVSLSLSLASAHGDTLPHERRLQGSSLQSRRGRGGCVRNCVRSRLSLVSTADCIARCGRSALTQDGTTDTLNNQALRQLHRALANRTYLTYGERPILCAEMSTELPGEAMLTLLQSRGAETCRLVEDFSKTCLPLASSDALAEYLPSVRYCIQSEGAGDRDGRSLGACEMIRGVDMVSLQAALQTESPSDRCQFLQRIVVDCPNMVHTAPTAAAMQVWQSLLAACAGVSWVSPATAPDAGAVVVFDATLTQHCPVLPRADCCTCRLVNGNAIPSHPVPPLDGPSSISGGAHPVECLSRVSHIDYDSVAAIDNVQLIYNDGSPTQSHGAEHPEGYAQNVMQSIPCDRYIRSVTWVDFRRHGWLGRELYWELADASGAVTGTLEQRAGYRHSCADDSWAQTERGGCAPPITFHADQGRAITGLQFDPSGRLTGVLTEHVRRRRLQQSSHWSCDSDKNWVEGLPYSQTVLSDGATTNSIIPTTVAVATCKHMCLGQQAPSCTGFFYQKHWNNHQICGFYRSPSPYAEHNVVWHNHSEGAVCQLLASESPTPASSATNRPYIEGYEFNISRWNQTARQPVVGRRGACCGHCAICNVTGNSETNNVATSTLPQRHSEGACASVQTGDTYNYDDALILQPLGPSKTITFNLTACNDGHIGFYSSLPRTTTSPGFHEDGVELYEIVLSGWGNTASVIRQSSQGANEVRRETSWLLSCHEPRAFWARAQHGLVQVGTGHVPDQNVLLQWQDPDPHEAMFVGLMTGWGSSGTWNVCHNGWSAPVTLLGQTPSTDRGSARDQDCVGQELAPAVWIEGVEYIDHCEQLCRAKQGCSAFVWRLQNGGKCKFFQGHVTRRGMPGRYCVIMASGNHAGADQQQELQTTVHLSGAVVLEQFRQNVASTLPPNTDVVVTHFVQKAEAQAIFTGLSASDFASSQQQFVTGVRIALGLRSSTGVDRGDIVIKTIQDPGRRRLQVNSEIAVQVDYDVTIVGISNEQIATSVTESISNSVFAASLADGINLASAAQASSAFPVLSAADVVVSEPAFETVIDFRYVAQVSTTDDLVALIPSTDDLTNAATAAQAQGSPPISIVTGNLLDTSMTMPMGSHDNYEKHHSSQQVWKILAIVLGILLVLGALLHSVKSKHAPRLCSRTPSGSYTVDDPGSFEANPQNVVVAQVLSSPEPHNSHLPVVSAAAPIYQGNIAQELRELQQLREQGVLSETEFIRAKEQVLTGSNSVITTGNAMAAPLASAMGFASETQSSSVKGGSNVIMQGP